MNDLDFNTLCDTHGLVRGDFLMVHRAMIKTLLDAAVATETRTQQERIKRLEEMYEKEIGENDKFIGTNLQALLTRELNAANAEIQSLKYNIDRVMGMYAAKDNQICNLLHICRDNDIEVSSYDLIHGKEAKP